MKTSKKDFSLVKEECLRWIEFFGFKDWVIEILHDDTDLIDAPLAWVDVNSIDNYAVIYLNKEWVDSKELHNDATIKMIAFHECCEILLAELEDVARERFLLSEDSIVNARHKIINRLENSVFKALS